MLEIATVADTVRPVFPHGINVLQQMADQGINALGILGGSLHGLVVTPKWLVTTMLEEVQHPEHRASTINDMEATFREVASALEATAPK